MSARAVSSKTREIKRGGGATRLAYISIEGHKSGLSKRQELFLDVQNLEDKRALAGV